jgi:hypothetical protein
MPTRLDETGRKMRSLQIWKVSKLTCGRRGAADRGEYREAAGAVAEAIIHSLVFKINGHSQLLVVCFLALLERKTS